jgi:predicted DNA-binding transcriptional regulator YafY
MRADRLLSILLLLQANGRMSAGDLACRLEVSRRTVYRDLDALSGAGVPIVTDRGPNGGASLLDGYRTDLTGLTESELEALLAFGGRGPAADLGLGPQLDQASRKLAVAAGSGGAGRLQERVLIDGERWFRTAAVPPHLARVQDALWSDRRLRLRYRRALERVVERTVEPYGLICKAGTWYLLAGVEGQPRVYRVSRIEDAELIDETFERPAGFDLRTVWAGQVGRFTGSAAERMSVTVRVAPGVSDRFTRLVGEQIVGRSQGGVAVLDFAACDAAVSVLTAFGGAVEVLAPDDLRERMAELGRQLSGMYGGPIDPDRAGEIVLEADERRQERGSSPAQRLQL